MPFVCKNGYTGVCGTSRGCYCFCNNAYQGDCEEKCFCNIGTDSNPYLQGLGSKTVYSGIKIVECIGNYDMFYDDENMADSDVSVVHHTDIYNDPIYKHPIHSGGYQTSTGIYVETLIDRLPPEIIIEIDWGEY